MVFKRYSQLSTDEKANRASKSKALNVLMKEVNKAKREHDSYWKKRGTVSGDYS